MVSREVYEVLKAYEKMGVVELIPAENLPTSSETGFNPDSWIFRTGDRVYQNDCVMRAKTKFVASIDSDEIMIPQGNLTMLEFLENEIKNDPKVGGFQLFHQAMQYDPKKMSHLKASRKDFDWKKLEYDWLKTASIHNKNWAMGKSINMPDHVNIISIHFIAQMQHPYKILDVPHAKAVYYHVRISWLGKENPTKENNSHLYEPKLRSFFNDDFVKTVLSNYQKVMKEVETNMGRKPITYYEVFDILPKCLKDWRSYHQCSPLVMCYKDLSNFTEWVYANPSNYEAKYLLTL
uniref:Glycosyltransferase family 92 protein n=1 Tax=Acrobeloides nanus TaxID=290746 RepID=A0A914EHH6_9BILA